VYSRKILGPGGTCCSKRLSKKGGKKETWLFLSCWDFMLLPNDTGAISRGGKKREKLMEGG